MGKIAETELQLERIKLSYEFEKQLTLLKKQRDKKLQSIMKKKDAIEKKYQADERKIRDEYAKELQRFRTKNTQYIRCAECGKNSEQQKCDTCDKNACDECMKSHENGSHCPSCVKEGDVCRHGCLVFEADDCEICDYYGID